MDSQNTQIPSYITWKLKHYQKTMNWNCGLSCVIMCLDDQLRYELLKDTPKLCIEKGCCNSAWMIELCYLIKKRAPHISFHFTTIRCIERCVDTDYESEKFYSPILTEDIQRINNLFKESAQNGIKVDKRSVSIFDLINHVATKGVCIVLTNANILSCDICENHSGVGKKTRYASNVVKYLCCSTIPSYQGHYVVVCGYRLKEKKIIYRNPTYSDRECVTSFENFDDARTSYGTDEDVVFIDLDVTGQNVGRE